MTSRHLRSLRACVLAIVAVPAFGQVPVSSGPIATTLCEIVAHPEEFADKLVRFKAYFESDGMDHSILVQPGCQRGIVPYPAADGKKRADVQRFEEAIDAGAPGTADKIVVATFTGRFVWKPPSKRILRIEGVSDLRVSHSSSRPRERQK